MTWIEGVGDEVPIFFVLAAIIVVAFMVLAWKSTDVPEQSLSLPVLTFTISSRESTASTASNLLTDDGGSPSFPGESTSNQEVPLTLNPDLILSHQATISSSHSQLATHEETNIESGVSGEEVSHLRRRVTDTSAEHSEDVISVKLMYMDDTNRIVESPLHSTIGDFKKKHFKNELNANKVVKLIFNGQILNEESSLSQLGLENNCVVHCLIHQPRSANTAPPAPPTNLLGPSNNTVEDHIPRQSNQQSTAEAGIDIGGLLVPLFGVILGLVWYCRIAYATHFTAAATTALVGLSGLCVFSFFIIWYPTADQDG